MDVLKTELKNYIENLQPVIKEIFDEERSLASSFTSLTEEMVSKLECYTDGGKKLRGFLTYLMCGDHKASLTPEIFHAGLLIHDDWIDNDEARHNKPTVHIEYRGEIEDQHLADSMAVVVGDLAFFLSSKILASSPFLPENKIKAVKYMSEGLMKTGYGEALDICDKILKVGFNEVQETRVLKTAYYTVVLPLSIGAHLLGLNDDVLRAIKEYGTNVGLAFQLRDDYLGIFGDEKITGKSVTSDIKEGKKTMLYFKALELASEGEKRYLKDNYGRRGLTMEEIQKIKEIIQSSGTVAFSHKYSRELVDKGKKYVPDIVGDSKKRQILLELADYLIEREK